MEFRGHAALLLLTPFVLGGGAAPERVRVRGSVAYESREPTARGASARLTERPARFVEVAVRAVGGRDLATASADETGRFELDAPAEAAELVVRARVTAGGRNLAVSGDANGRRTHEMVVPLPRRGARAEVVARDDGSRGFGGALHILDAVMRGFDAVREWTGESLPPLYVFWARGVTTDWSYFRGERPDGSGRFCLEVLGVPEAELPTGDTDEHDEEILLHEFGHFVMDRFTGVSMIGGGHPPGSLLDPGVAWEEGRAIWFAAAALGLPPYRDCIGREPGGRLRVDYDLERGTGGIHGLGSELDTAAVLWDLTDGVEGIPDGDDDGVALGPAAVLLAMVETNEEPGAYPCIATFLRRLVRVGAVGEAAARRMVRATGGPDALLPESDESPWPVDLAPGTPVRGRIDGLSNPAPSGGPPRTDDGFDAVKAYRVNVPSRSQVEIDLRLTGSGRPDEHSDADLELRTLDSEVIAASRGEGATETIRRTVDPGWYIVYVKDGGDGNRVDYELVVRIGPVR